MEDKLSGLQNLESMSHEASMAVKIAKDNIAKIIGPFLVDENKLVRAATASTLRNIADNGGEDAYLSLLKDDIMTPLTALIKNVSIYFFVFIRTIKLINFQFAALY